MACEIHGDLACASVEASSRDSKSSDGNSNFSLQSRNCYSITDFDFCRLAELTGKSDVECVICKQRNVITKTDLMCISCNIACCPSCYDYHRRHEIFNSIRLFTECHFPVKLRVSKCNDLETLRAGTLEKHPHFSLKHDVCSSELPTDHTSQRCIHSSHEEPVASCSSQDFHDLDCTEKELNFTTIKPAVAFMKEHHSVITEVNFDSEGKLKCMYFQDSQMKDVFNFYSRRVCIDVSCKIDSLDVVVYLFLTEDCDGRYEIICVSLISYENVDNLTWLFTTFKKYNPSWRNMKFLVADTLIRNREVIRRCFPDIYVIGCPYHAIRTFKQDLDGDNNLSDVSSDQKQHALGIFENMILSSSEMQYSLFHQQLHLLHCALLEYFEKNWSPFKNEWRINIGGYGSVLYGLNIFLSFIEDVLKPLFNTAKTLLSFVQKIFFSVKILRLERQKKVSALLESPNFSLYSKFTPQFSVSEVLTPYAAEFVNAQLDKSAEMSINSAILLDKYTFLHLETTVSATYLTCSCEFFTSMSLPCCHIFAIRRAFSIPIFAEGLCDVYWTKSYYFATHKVLTDSYQTKCENNSLQNEDNCFGSDLINKLMTLVVSCPPNSFNHRISSLNKLVFAWKENATVHLLLDGCEGTQSSLVFQELVPSAETEATVKEEYAQSEPTSSFQLQNYAEAGPVEEKCNKPNFLVTNCEFGTHTFEGEAINFIYIVSVICKTKETCVRWLRHMKFLPSAMHCPACRSPMTYKSMARLSDGAIWVCRKVKEYKKCDKRCSLRQGTWLEGTTMPLQQILIFVYMWIHDFPQQNIISELGMFSTAYMAWNKCCRRICARTLQDQSTMETNLVSDSLQESDPSDFLMDTWLQKNSDVDVFVAFLTDAKNLHQRGYSLF